MPARRPLNIVVGAPIDCPKMIDMDAPETRETVDRIHKEYMEVGNCIVLCCSVLIASRTRTES